MSTTTTQLEHGETYPQSIELSSHPTRTLGQQQDFNSDESPEPAKRDFKTYLRLISVGFSFFVAGVNDGSIGALLPYIIRDYDINTAIVSAVYGANFAGWFLAALTNTHLCQYFNLGSMLIIGALLQVVAHALRAWNPPFGLFVVTFCLVSLGQAYQDTHGNTYVAGLKGAHRWLAFIHAMYMAGCLVAPFVATGVASAGEKSQWYLFYTFPLGLGIANLALVYGAFRDTVTVNRKKATLDEPTLNENTEVSRNDDAVSLIKETLKDRSVWLLSLFFFFFLGATLTASGWVVEYLVEVRDGDLSAMGYVPAGFNGGSLLGRLLLAEPTHRFGPRKMVFIFAVLSIGLQLMFWLVPNIIAASIAISFLGFFMGPFFATGISEGSKLFSPRIQSTALAFVFVFAQLGGSFFPIITGLVSLNSGVKVLQPILCGLLGATAISWLLIPRPKESGNTALHHE